MNSFFLSGSLPSNAEGSAEQSEAIGASWRTEIRIIFPFLLTLAPFVNLSVDTFPDKRGQLTFPVLFFLGEKSFTTSRKTQFSRAVILERQAEPE